MFSLDALPLLGVLLFIFWMLSIGLLKNDMKIESSLSV